MIGEVAQSLLCRSADGGLIDDREAHRILGPVQFGLGDVERPAGAKHAASFDQGLGHVIGRDMVQGVREDDNVERVVVEWKRLARRIDVAVRMFWIGLESSSEHLGTAIGPHRAGTLVAQPPDQAAVAAAHVEHVPVGHLDSFGEDIASTAEGHRATLGLCGQGRAISLSLLRDRGSVCQPRPRRRCPWQSRCDKTLDAGGVALVPITHCVEELVKEIEPQSSVCLSKWIVDDASIWPMNCSGFDMTDRRALRSIAVQFFVNGALFASFVPRLPEIRDRVGISVAGVGALLSIAGVFGLVGSTRLITLSVAMTGTGLAVASLVPNRFLIVAGYVLAGVGIAALLPTAYDTAAKRPGRLGAGLGALTAGMRTAILVVPFVIGAIAGTRLGVGSAVAIVALPSTFVFLLMNTKLRRS